MQLVPTGQSTINTSTQPLLFTARTKPRYDHIVSSYAQYRASPSVDHSSRNRTRLGTSQSQREYESSPLSEDCMSGVLPLGIGNVICTLGVLSHGINNTI